MNKNEISKVVNDIYECINWLINSPDESLEIKTKQA